MLFLLMCLFSVTLPPVAGGVRRSEHFEVMPRAHVIASPMPNPHLLTSIDTGEKLNIPLRKARPFLNFVHTSARPADSIPYQSLGIDVIPYSDIAHYLPHDHSGTNTTLSMADVARTCTGSYVQWLKPGHPLIYLTDPRIPGTLAAWERWYANFVAAGGRSWGIYEDTADNPFTYAYPAPPCNAAHTGVVSQIEWNVAEMAMEGAMQRVTGKAVIFNGLAAGYNRQMPAADALLDGPVAGGEAEACAPHDAIKWLNQLAIEIHAVLRHKYFFCHGNDFSDGSTPQAIAFRQYHFATMMLDYDPARTIYESFFAVGASKLRVQPESEVVMLYPLTRTIRLTTDLLRIGGAYGRRYKTCYVAGVLVGECAVVVNPTVGYVPFPFPLNRFHHTLLLSGSGVHDGGTVSALGPLPGPMLAPFTGEVAFP